MQTPRRRTTSQRDSGAIVQTLQQFSAYLDFDISPVDVPHEEEVERILALGATRADVGQTGEESWTVLADPEGNEFCLLAPG